MSFSLATLTPIWDQSQVDVFVENHMETSLKYPKSWSYNKILRSQKEIFKEVERFLLWEDTVFSNLTFQPINPQISNPSTHQPFHRKNTLWETVRYWKWPSRYIVDLLSYKMVDLSIVFCMFTRPGTNQPRPVLPSQSFTASSPGGDFSEAMSGYRRRKNQNDVWRSVH